ncbi:thiamine pyrophosphokinase [Thermosipho melanesiensis]|uniref:Thiamine diphosphokinase n=2 Tax=Thermosipho melanesiensis TaxID=46541 RepID=A6LJ14_THEM4|nr:thiamine diphosphokinase [Thermosipho melanesiensis]ABR29915.1 thiamine pyrophosphokinase [Thermosipho melanesiensis BI429]APT73123.1 thiamine pyrophosphokinase [Thermosipho melanesiensis]OOC38521.1 thiamine pyrophosphokinase [Thermosipho melanesiensis]OOC40325.1 thiamine pyrophosphokinase [Thermosipho melanesiensis]OOC40589.1 thiamine pyrophosphokinase [Thermosipho melanesiensis]
MKATIVLNGNTNETFIINSETIIAVDGGAKLLKDRGILPKAIVGDMDSLENEIIEYFKRKNVEIVVFPAEKDETDCELAIRYAIENGYDEIEIINFFGERLDMILSLFGLMKKFNVKITLRSEKLECGIIKKQMEKKVKIGEIWSFIPLCKAKFNLYGFKYQFNGEMKIDNPIGVSNETISENVKIEVLDGEVIYFRWMKKPL